MQIRRRIVRPQRNNLTLCVTELERMKVIRINPILDIFWAVILIAVLSFVLIDVKSIAFLVTCIGIVFSSLRYYRRIEWYDSKLVYKNYRFIKPLTIPYQSIESFEYCYPILAKPGWAGMHILYQDGNKRKRFKIPLQSNDNRLERILRIIKSNEILREKKLDKYLRDEYEKI